MVGKREKKPCTRESKSENEVRTGRDRSAEEVRTDRCGGMRRGPAPPGAHTC